MYVYKYINKHGEQDHGINFKQMPNTNQVEHFKKVELSEETERDVMNCTVAEVKEKIKHFLETPGYRF